MREVLKHLIVFSVENGAVHCKHEELIEYLHTNDIPYQEVLGCYNGRKQPTVIVGAESMESFKWLCARSGQECYLLLDEDRNGTLVYMNTGKGDYIGKWCEIDKPNGDYTKDLITGKFYTCK
jgi:hypothetical protein